MFLCVLTNIQKKKKEDEFPRMDYVEHFGKTLDSLVDKHPNRSRGLLKFGWGLMNFKFKALPDRRLCSADRYLAHVMMDTMLRPLKKPDQAVAISVFVPCELLQEVKLNPYNVESFSCYLSASSVSRPCIELAEANGVPETLCSYHKTFIGAAQRGFMPRPKCIVYTNLTCDANMLTFKTLAELFNVPSFEIDVPDAVSEASVSYVADQLRNLARFLENQTGRVVDENALRVRVERGKRTLETYKKFHQLRRGKDIPSDLVSPLYAAMTSNILLGSEEEEHYVNQLVEDAKKAALKRGVHIYWMHTIPYWSEATARDFAFSDRAQIVGCDIGQLCEPEFDTEDPYRAMAWRMVHNNLNGGALRRIEAGITHAREVGADGVVWFNHWGCKHTIGASQLAKCKFEEAGLPFLALDGDGLDSAHGGEGQTATRLDAFLEMLEA